MTREELLLQEAKDIIATNSHGQNLLELKTLIKKLEDEKRALTTNKDKLTKFVKLVRDNNQLRLSVRHDKIT